MAGVTRRVIGSFEEIGKDVIKQVAQAPVDIAQKAVESLGTTGGKKQQTTPTTPAEGKKPEGPLSEIDKEKDQKVKKAIARAALEQLAGKKPPKEPSVWEKLQKEAEQKKELQKQQAQAAQQSQLPSAKSRRPRGDLYGLKAKRASAEMSRNVRQD